MNKLLAAAAIVASLGAALPAAAQTFGGGQDRGYNGGGYDRGFNGGGYDRGFNGGGVSPDRRIEFRIERGLRDGSLTEFEANRLGRELDQIHRLERQYSRNGVNASEARELDRRYASLEFRLRNERRDRDRGYGQGYGGDRGSAGYR
jgi:hypothetical protein